MAKKRYSVFNMYLTTTVSVSLVLFFIGSLIMLFFLTRDMTHEIKENVVVTAVLYDEIDSLELTRIKDVVTISPYAKSVTYISKADALAEHVENLGENPADFLGYNPLNASYEIRMNKTYAHLDSIRHLEVLLDPFVGVKSVVYNKELVDIVSHNVSSITWVLLLIAAVLLGISMVLISNTIRLSIYSKRFLINTMKLVGAKPWAIRAPFVARNLLMGFVASIMASALIYGCLYYIQYEVGVSFLLTDHDYVVGTFGSVLLLGLFISFVSSYVAVGKYIRMKTNDLYYI